MRLDIFSDVICPWCFIGKRRLERALAARPLPDLTAHWRAFQLNPDMPAEGMDRQHYIEAKFGDKGRAEEIYERVTAAGRGDGIAFAFDKIRRTPNTVQAHRLIRLASREGGQDAMVERLFLGYFLEGADLSSDKTLAMLAAEAGLGRNDVASYLRGAEDRTEVEADSQLAYRAGISGVPCFVVDGKFALAGAQEPEAFGPLFDAARADGESVRAASD
ncbi:MAG: DsbA family oxidoreductase [Proteobacteria bacterium]|nr:DsbA family oxidoreductase [Pseudomonadota bacterium]MBI3498840.1 DsbA family oxidoreductase [Pseudomonadota bacterium]